MKFFAVLLCIVIVFSLSSCGGGKSALDISSNEATNISSLNDSSDRYININPIACKSGNYYYYINNPESGKYTINRIDESGQKKVIYSTYRPIDYIQSVDDNTICFTLAYIPEDDVSNNNSDFITYAPNKNIDVKFSTWKIYRLMDLNTQKTVDLTLDPGDYPYGDVGVPCWVNDYIIFTIKPSKFQQLWSKNKDGKYTCICEAYQYYYIYNNKIYFSSINKQTGKIEKLSNCNFDGTDLNSLNIDNIFYVFDNIEISVNEMNIKINNKKTNIVKELNLMSYLSFGGYDGKYIYFKGEKLIRYDISDGSTLTLFDKDVDNISILENWIYFSFINGNTPIYKVKKDGSSLEKIT